MTRIFEQKAAKAAKNCDVPDFKDSICSLCDLRRLIVGPQGSCARKIARYDTYVHYLSFNSFLDSNFGFGGEA
jgi:hypothetical protein